MPKRLSKESKAGLISEIKAGMREGKLDAETRKAIKTKYGVADSSITYELNKIPKAQGGNKADTLSDAVQFAKEETQPEATITEEQPKQETPEGVKEIQGDQQPEAEESLFSEYAEKGLPKEIIEQIIKTPFDLIAGFTSVEEWQLSKSEVALASAGYEPFINDLLKQLLKGDITPAKTAIITTILLLLGKSDAIKKTIEKQKIKKAKDVTPKKPEQVATTEEEKKIVDIHADDTPLFQK